jgi:hypothetical protein
VTLSLAPVDPLAAAGTWNTLDTYGYWTNVSVMTRGRMWVVAGADVAPGQAVYYDAGTGLLCEASGGVAATGTITFTSNPVDATTITVRQVKLSVDHGY